MNFDAYVALFSFCEYPFKKLSFSILFITSTIFSAPAIANLSDKLPAFSFLFIFIFFWNNIFPLTILEESFIIDIPVI